MERNTIIQDCVSYMVLEIVSGYNNEDLETDSGSELYNSDGL